MALIAVRDNVFENDDGVINDETDSRGEAAKGH